MRPDRRGRGGPAQAQRARRRPFPRSCPPRETPTLPTPQPFLESSLPTPAPWGTPPSPNTSQFLLVSSWDTSVRLYDVPANSMRLKYQHTGAVLDCAFYVGVLRFSSCILLSFMVSLVISVPFAVLGEGSCR